jgi:hypothetical protein
MTEVYQQKKQGKNYCMLSPERIPVLQIINNNDEEKNNTVEITDESHLKAVIAGKRQNKI